MRYRFSLARREAAGILTGAAGVGVLLFCSGLLTGVAVANDPAAAIADDAVLVESGEDAPVDEGVEASVPAPSPAAAEADGLPSDEIEFPADGEPEYAAADPVEGVGGPGEAELAEETVYVPALPLEDEPSAAAPAAPGTPAWRVGSDGSLEMVGAEEIAAAWRSEESAKSSGEAGGPAPLPTPRARAARRVPPPPPARDPNAPPPRFAAYDGNGPYSLEVGRYRDEETALEVMNDLVRRGREAYLYVRREGRAVVFHVRLERYLDRATAMRAAEALERREQLAALVVPAGEP
jgi:sporulation related protein